MGELNWIDYWFRPQPDGSCRIDAPEVRAAQLAAEIERCKHRDQDCPRGIHSFIHGSCEWCHGFVEDITPLYLPQPQ
jgi:hypothetical protein